MPDLAKSIKKIIRDRQLKRYIRHGLQVGAGCKFNGMPDFGSEPYLVTLGDHVEISGKVTFITHDGATWVFRGQHEYRHVIKFGRIVVGDNCFIGYGSIILPGVTIGANSVVGAGSVVVTDVPIGTVAAGNPARPIRSTEQYADRCLAATPKYDLEGFRRDKQNELLKIYPRPGA